MVTETAVLTAPTGLHMRPASLFAQEMSKFRSKVSLRHADKVIDGKSVMLLIAAALKPGSEIVVECDGPDEAEALRTAVELLTSGLGEG